MNNVIIVILTDGYENASKIYSSKDIQKKIRKQEEKHGWQFVFIGANQDAILEASKIGISRSKALEFNANDDGIKNAFRSVSYCMSASMVDDSSDFSFSEKDREKQNES